MAGGLGPVRAACLLREFHVPFDNLVQASKLPRMDPQKGTNPRKLSPELRDKEAEAARKAAHEMWVAGLTIVLSFVLVLVLVALVVIIGHIPLF